MKTAVVWFRRDLRLADNPALDSALSCAEKVVLLYIHAPHEEHPWCPGAASNWWLHHSLQAMRRELKQCNADLVIRRGDSLTVLDEIRRKVGAEGVFWNTLYEPAMKRRDQQARHALRTHGLQVRCFNGTLLREPGDVLKKDGTPYRVFTPFSKCYQGLELPAPLPAPARIRSAHGRLDSLDVSALGLLPALRWYDGLQETWQPGEEGARIRLNVLSGAFLDTYPAERDIPALEGSSMLSPHLHFGEVSPSRVWQATDVRPEPAPGVVGNMPAWSFRRQLVWRDFAHHVLWNNPHTSDRPFNRKFEGFNWESDPALLERWKRGETGIPIVDAGMRQLWHTGWMHNRVRMIAASVLCKNGLVPWQEGARWFWDTLVDADLANNSMGWQWVAGCGADAAPYFRIFSPVRQGRRFDPQGRYVKRWVPELEMVPKSHVHDPWNMPATISGASGILTGKDYPAPALDLSGSRHRAFERFKLLRE